MVSCQTSKYYGSTHHDKALLARAPLSYALGFHTCAEVAAIVSICIVYAIVYAWYAWP